MDNCVENLRKLIEEIESLKATDSDNPEYEVWKGKVLRQVKKCFGDNSDYVNEIKDVLNPGIIVTKNTPDSYWTKLHLNTLNSAKVHLKAYVEDLEQASENQIINRQQDDNTLAKDNGNIATPLEKLELLFKRFHLVAKNLTRRYDNRSTFQICDEYDVQDLLKSLMIIFFDDIRLEERTSGYASKSVKMDFLLNKEEIVVECKMTRANHTEKKISDELIIDIARYVKHARCKRLVCLIYDPTELIQNKSVLYDLQDKSTPDFSVHVYVIP